ncbi:AAA family ATPase [Oceanobacillus sp. FSL K6-2867]|uniref:AAA family ATPase n=1 Tax=Oceanobacillus sp. FSL K6-2867 TaxID=2954748 RepID=UPI0030D8487A
MEHAYIKRQLTKDGYIDFAFRRYQKFKQKPAYDEAYKKEILSQLNSYFQNAEITNDNIVDLIKKIKDSNPSSGSFVHWSNTSDLYHFTSEQPSEVATSLSDFYRNHEVPLQVRIETFLSRAKTIKPDIRLGAPLFGYLLAAYDYQNFPLYKESIFNNVKKLFGIKTKLRSISENYQDFYDICLTVKDYLLDRGYTINMLDVQDFFYCLSQRDEVKTESAVDFIYDMSNELARFEEDSQLFINKISLLDRKDLEKKRKSYENSEKVREIRYRILDQLLKHGSMTVQEMERIKEEISQQYERKILHSWNNFSILFPLYYDSFEEKVNICLRDIHQSIQQLDALKGIKLKEDQVIKDFNWNNNFGTTESWLAVYPVEHETHRTAAQLFLGVKEKHIDYGIVYGTENPNRGEEYLTNLRHAEEFSYEQMEKKFDELVPKFLEENQLQDEEGVSPSSSERVIEVFSSLEEADWAFNFIKQTLNKLGITAPNDLRMAATYPGGRKFHIDYGNWLIVGFRQGANGQTEIRLAMINAEIDDLPLNKEMFTTKESEPSIALITLLVEEFKASEKLQHVYADTIDFIKEKFKNHQRTQYRVHNNEQLEAAIFNEEKRTKLFSEGLKKEQIDILKETEEVMKYFWLTCKPAIWTVENIKDGGSINFTAYNEKGNKRRIFSAFESANPGDKVLFYESTPRKEIIAQGEVTEGLHLVDKEGYPELVEAVTFRYKEEVEPISWEVISEVEELQNSAPIRNGAQGSLFELTEEEFKTILSLEPTEIQVTKNKIPTIDFDQEVDVATLYFEEKDQLIRQVETALKNGKHIILTGPPGTGKSKLAKEICLSYQPYYKMATATSDWSTYETIGGYKPNSDGTLSFQPGIFLDCFKNPNSNQAINKWLVIDEINRADIDKAFGSLFSALTGDKVTLNFKSESKRTIELKPQHDENIKANDYEYIIPRDWRMIGTMNTLDKASLYEMSYAFMRRFAFIPVGVPRQIDESLIDFYLDIWNIADYPHTGDLAFIWENINYYRPIGPAIVEDIANHTISNGDFTSAMILYVLPQFEGILDKDIIEFVDRISQSPFVEKKRLLQFCQDFFHVKV